MHAHFASHSPSLKSIHRILVVVHVVRKFEVINIINSVVDAPRSGRPRSVNTPENELSVALAFIQSPEKSTRRASVQLQITSGHPLRNDEAVGFKGIGLPTTHAAWIASEKRTLRSFLIKLPVNPTSSTKWSDEASFKLNGRVSTHTAYYWAYKTLIAP